MAVQIAGLVVLIVLYLAILALGIWSGKKRTHHTKDGIFLANRNFGMVVATFTLTATMVGGGYINGTAEVIYKSGFVWTQAPIAYSLGMVLGGAFFAPKLRRARYTTVFDPFQIRYGYRLGAIMFIPQLLGDIFWGGAILNALGASLSIILDLNQTISVIVSACIAIVYTLFGGLYAVAYTDIVQMILIAVGLYGSFPFALHNSAVNITRVMDNSSWLGEIAPDDVGMFIDDYLMLTMGGIPWQEFFQRSLACRTPFIAGAGLALGGVFAAVQAIPATVIGIVALGTDWNQTSYNGTYPFGEQEKAMILPLVLHHLCPVAVSVIGLGAVSAAVMSSADSMVLSVGTCVAHNIYKNIFRPHASDRELMWILRVALVLAGIVSSVVALVVSSVYVLFYLCSDILYVINFPQLVCCLWFPFVDSYGYVAGTITSVILRFGGGEKYLNFPAVIKYPGFDSQTGIQHFPYKSFSMICGFITTILVSLLTRFLFRGIIPLKYDFLAYYQRQPDQLPELKEKPAATEGDEIEDIDEEDAKVGIDEKDEKDERDSFIDQTTSM